jgi:hypothetical protein
LRTPFAPAPAAPRYGPVLKAPNPIEPRREISGRTSGVVLLNVCGCNLARQVINNHAISLLNVHTAKTARDILSVATEIFPEYSNGHYNRGLAHFLLVRNRCLIHPPDTGTSTPLRTHDILASPQAPAEALALTLRWWCPLVQGEHDQAIRHLARSWQYDAANPVAMSYLGQSELMLHEQNSANHTFPRAQLRKCIKAAARHLDDAISRWV